MKVVSNAGPLIALGKLGQLGLLIKLYGQVEIPREVYNEVVVNGLRFGASDARVADFLVRQGHIRVVDIILPSLPLAWAVPIDAGEVEAILLGLQRNADWVLIDDAHARKAACQAGLRVKGTVGVLLIAFRQGHISLNEFELLIQNIESMPELWISECLCERALAQARRETGR